MPDEDIEVKNKEVPGWPGWTKVQVDANNRRYISPGGTEISDRRFRLLSKHPQYKAQGYIPESAVLPPSTSNKSGFISDIISPKKKKDDPQDQIPHQQDISEIIEDNDPRPKNTPRNIKHPRPSAAMLSAGFKRLALLITAGVIAKLLDDDRAALSEHEATVLGIALGNILEPTKLNDEFGWIVAETGDWQALGYIVITYLSRLNEVLQDKKHQRQQGVVQQPFTNQYQQQQSNGHQPVTQNADGRPVYPPVPGLNLGGRPTPPGARLQ